MAENENQGGNSAGSPDAEARIQELTAKIGELKTLLDQKSAMEQQEMANRQAQEEASQQNLGYDPNSEEIKQWAPWLAPKIAPFLAERDRVIVSLADKLDELETINKFPEFADEEFASKVSKTIRDTKKNRGIVLSRMDAIRLLKGEEVISKRGKNEEGSGQQQQQAPQQVNVSHSRRVNSPVESGVGVGTTRAAQTTTKDPENLSIEEFEAQFGDMRV